MLFYSPSLNAFYDSTINVNIPKDAVEISKEQKAELFKEQASGKIIKANESGFPELVDKPIDYIGKERAWRDRELSRADIELYKVQDSDPKAVGSVAQWREYRKALRAYPETQDFPSKDKRPVAPDA